LYRLYSSLLDSGSRPGRHRFPSARFRMVRLQPELAVLEALLEDLLGVQNFSKMSFIT
jgi:hypothetical protein